jgi:hypothetical protein
VVLIDWPREFEAYRDRLEAKAEPGVKRARSELDFLLAELDVLAKLDAAPVSDSASLKPFGSPRITRYGASLTRSATG